MRGRVYFKKRLVVTKLSQKQLFSFFSAQKQTSLSDLQLNYKGFEIFQISFELSRYLLFAKQMQQTLLCMNHNKGRGVSRQPMFNERGTSYSI